MTTEITQIYGIRLSHFCLLDLLENNPDHPWSAKVNNYMENNVNKLLYLSKKEVGIRIISDLTQEKGPLVLKDLSLYLDTDDLVIGYVVSKITLNVPLEFTLIPETQMPWVLDTSEYQALMDADPIFKEVSDLRPSLTPRLYIVRT